MTDAVFLIDSGHGGLINGQYQTAPNKMYRFPTGDYSWEGVINRRFKHELFHEMDNEGLQYIDICPTDLDLDLDLRVKNVKNICYKYPHTVLISIHNNASEKHNARGSEVWTTEGLTVSDYHTDIYGQKFINVFPNIHFRGEKKKGKFDKESMFYILRKVPCPAFLPEILFFDSWSDYQLLIDPVFRHRWVIEVMIPYMKEAIINDDIW
jgi:N-acetylmuramoyl-L-alanine amidase